MQGIGIDTAIILACVGIIAGLFGVLLGLGGGAIIVPMLTLIPYFHLTIHQAVAISIVCVLGVSLGGTVRYVEEGLTDIRLGVLLTIGTTAGAIIGSLVSHLLKAAIIEVLFSLILFYASYEMIRNQFKNDIPDGSYKHPVIGLSLVSISGMFAGLFGVGGGAINVPVMHLIMDVPMKKTTATSNFMIGSTASAASLVYLLNGSIQLHEVAPLAIGTFAGAKLGAMLLKRIHTILLKRIFAIVLVLIGFQMLYHAVR